MSDSEHSAHGSRLLRKALGVAGFTLLSRVLGLLRDILMTGRFGAADAYDAWNIAFLLPNLLRRVLAEGALSVSIVPVMSRARGERGDDGVRSLFRDTFGLQLLVVAAAMVVFYFVAPWLVEAFAPGFQDDKQALTTLLARANIGFIFFILLSTVGVAAVNSFDHFAAPALGASLQNIALIAGIVWIAALVDPPVLGVSIGAAFAGLATFVVVYGQAARMGFSLRPRFRLDPAHKEMALLLVPGLAGVMVYYLNTMVGRALASLLGEGAVTINYLSDRLIELPLGVVAVSVATVSLPRLSTLAGAGDTRGIGEELARATRLSLFVSLPAAAGMWALRETMIRVLFVRGKFGGDDAALLADVLQCALPGLVFVAGVRVIVQAFYGLKRPSRVVQIAAVSFTVNGICGWFLMHVIGLPGLTLANSLAALTQLVLLAVLLRGELETLRAQSTPAAEPEIAAARPRGLGARTIRGLSQMTAAAAAMALVVRGCDRWLAPSLTSRGFTHAAVVLALEIGLGVAVYAALAALFKLDEFDAVRRRLASGGNRAMKTQQ